MPMYVFKCKDKKCATTQSKIQKFNDPAPPCTKCGGETERAIARGLLS